MYMYMYVCKMYSTFCNWIPLANNHTFLLKINKCSSPWSDFICSFVSGTGTRKGKREISFIIYLELWLDFFKVSISVCIYVAHETSCIITLQYVPVVYKVDSWGDHFNSLKQGSCRPRRVIKTKLRAFRDIKANHNCSFAKKNLRRFLIHCSVSAHGDNASIWSYKQW